MNCAAGVSTCRILLQRTKFPFQLLGCNRYYATISQPSATAESLNNLAVKIPGKDDSAAVGEEFLQSNPYERPKSICFFCAHKVHLDYKNSRLLQQFVSNFSGRVYDRNVTGLCEKQYKHLIETIQLSRRAGYMPSLAKDPKYLRDPKLYDPMRPIKAHKFA